MMLYLELKSPITVHEIVQELIKYVKKRPVEDRNFVLKKLYHQLMLYTSNLQTINHLINEKQKLGLSTVELKIFWVKMSFITISDIDIISNIGSKECRLYGIEQGIFPWGYKPFITFLYSSIPPFPQVRNYFENLRTLIAYAHQKNFLFIMGTIDDIKLIKILVEQGINGIVPNNPSNIFTSGIVKRDNQKSAENKHYVPLSMKRRLKIV